MPSVRNKSKQKRVRRATQRLQKGSGYCSRLRGQANALRLLSSMTPEQINNKLVRGEPLQVFGKTLRLSRKKQFSARAFRHLLPKMASVLLLINRLMRVFCAKNNFSVSVKEAKEFAKTMNIDLVKVTGIATLNEMPQDVQIKLNKQDVMTELLTATTKYASAYSDMMKATSNDAYRKAYFKTKTALSEPAARLVTGFASSVLEADEDRHINHFKKESDFIKAGLKNPHLFKKLQDNTTKDLHKQLNNTLQKTAVTVANEIPFVFRPFAKPLLKKKLTVPEEDVKDFLEIATTVSKFRNLSELQHNPGWKSAVSRVTDFISSRGGWEKQDASTVKKLLT